MDPKILKNLREGNMDLVLELLQNNPIQIGCKTVKGNNIFHIAASHGIIQAFSSSFMDLLGEPNGRGLLLHQNDKGDTILHCAARTGQTYILESLIPFYLGNQLIGVQNKRRDTSLHEAVRGGHVDAVCQLLAVGPEMAAVVNIDEESPLYLAVERRSVEVVEKLLDCSTVAAGGPRGQTALHAAVCQTITSSGGSEELQKVHGDMMVELGETRRLTPPTYLVADMLPWWIEKMSNWIGNEIVAVGDSFDARLLDIANKLLETKPELNKQVDASQSAPVHIAASLGDVKMVRLMLQKDTSVAHLLDNEGFSAIHIAASKDDVNMIMEILRHCPDATELTDTRGRNFLHVAANTRAVAVVKLVLNKSLLAQSINETDNEGNTPLHLAVKNHSVEIVRLLLLDWRIDTNVINREGLTPLDVASSRANSSLILRRDKIFNNLALAGSIQRLRRKNLMMGQNVERSEEELTRRKTLANNLTVVAILIATVTFSAAFTLPGGYAGDDSKQEEGLAILANKVAFKVFLISDAIAMISSFCAIFMLIDTELLDRNIDAMLSAVKYLSVALGGMAVAFSTGIYVVVAPKCKWLAVLVCGMAVCTPFVTRLVELFDNSPNMLMGKPVFANPISD